ncbi:MAG: DUF308 domain-containing protein [Muribaculaceae bacterium]|nr:DUF308 domain-containing protein [Muribaculaceae bacterium]
MKERTYLFTYLSSLIVGILLLIYHSDDKLYNGVVIAIGILIGIPSLIMLVSYLLPRKDKEGNLRPKPWYGIIASAAALGLGIWMVSDAAFFVQISIYTLGVVMILAGVAGMLFTIMAARPAPVQFLWLIVPILSIAAGVTVLVLGPKTIAGSAALITGIVLTVYSVNGFTSLYREGKTPVAVMADEPSSDTEPASEAPDIKKIEN